MMQERMQHDIETIRRLMVQARGVQAEHGPFMVLWGLLTALALAATWLAVRGVLGLGTGWIWGGMLVLGWAGSMALGGARSGDGGRRTAAGGLLAAIWIGAGVTLTLIAVSIFGAPTIGHQAMPGLVSIVLGAAYWATGQVTDGGVERWLALGWWAGGLAMLLWPGLWTLPAMAVLVLLLQVLPGVLALRRARRDRRVGSPAASSGA